MFCSLSGEDYVEEVRNDGGKVIAFECKLCECKFNDTQAREAHLKGRRHQLAYKVERRTLAFTLSLMTILLQGHKHTWRLKTYHEIIPCYK